jgi:glycosyltransferase involved in cell wall biosynthesis
MSLVDRIAYGTEASEALYREFVPPHGIQTRITHDLLASRVSSPPEKIPMTAVFVGALHERKGIDLAMRAWSSVESCLPASRIAVIGDGPLREQVESWVSRRPQSREFLGLVDHALVLDILRDRSVLIAPSQPYGHWREQVGRPIQEALAVGATVVTTYETGLAPWLLKHGHHVIPVLRSDHDLAPAIISALSEPLSPTVVLESLPVKDGRLIADAWLHDVS